MPGEALSQAEIESLMANMAVRDRAPTLVPDSATAQRWKLVKAYDFRRPEKLSKEHLRSLRNLHESFARLLASSLSSYLRTNVQVRLAEFEQTPYAEYIQALPSPTVLYMLGMSPLPGQALLQLDFTAARAILDRLLGGSGVPTASARELTEIELVLLKVLANALVRPLAEAWGHVHPITITTKDPTLSPEFVQIALPSEITVVFIFEIMLLGITGVLGLCVPYPVVQPALDSLAALAWSNAGATTGGEDERINVVEQLAPVELPVVAELGSATLSVRELMELAPGQIIKLDTDAGGTIAVQVGGCPKFVGRPGMVGRNLGVQVVRELD
jgi:flagellar motor switch protein FliM